MASSAPLACPIRQLVLHSYPAGLKVAAAERVTVFYGRRGKPVKKPRFIPAELAHQLARKLAAKRLGTVSVLEAAASWPGLAGPFCLLFTAQRRTPASAPRTLATGRA